jgi:hypothetical protein
VNSPPTETSEIPEQIKIKSRPAPLSFVLVAIVILNCITTLGVGARNHSDVRSLLGEIRTHQVAIASDTTQITNDRAFELILEEEIEVLAAQLVQAGLSPHLIPLPAPKPSGVAHPASG